MTDVNPAFDGGSDDRKSSDLSSNLAILRHAARATSFLKEAYLVRRIEAPLKRSCQRKLTED